MVEGIARVEVSDSEAAFGGSTGLLAGWKRWLLCERVLVKGRVVWADEGEGEQVARGEEYDIDVLERSTVDEGDEFALRSGNGREDGDFASPFRCRRVVKGNAERGRRASRLVNPGKLGLGFGETTLVDRDGAFTGRVVA